MIRETCTRRLFQELKANARHLDVVVLMYYFDNKQHKMPHIHVQYGDEEAVVSIPKENILSGTLPSAKLKLVHAWIEIHQDEFLADWRLAPTIIQD